FGLKSFRDGLRPLDSMFLHHFNNHSKKAAMIYRVFIILGRIFFYSILPLLQIIILFWQWPERDSNATSATGALSRASAVVSSKTACVRANRRARRPPPAISEDVTAR